MSHLVKISGDAKSRKKLLKEKSDCFPNSNSKIFGDKFRKDLEKLRGGKEKNAFTSSERKKYKKLRKVFILLSSKLSKEEVNVVQCFEYMSTTRRNNAIVRFKEVSFGRVKTFVKVNVDGCDNESQSFSGFSTSENEKNSKKYEE
ncbi:hypothetical protein KUTeg_005669 [Tegillarca granosa]|uniref:Uncharacterized protein n=1 Tax=Tegillarca granosa TaxID=220873 RepID=A0ABQ9FHL1_TEGGR|nr:hypothetical protein KUTeg_005669 [Tegillarca granosa]